MRDIKVYQSKVFEKIKKTNEFGMEYWPARDLVKMIEMNRG